MAAELTILQGNSHNKSIRRRTGAEGCLFAVTASRHCVAAILTTWPQTKSKNAAKVIKWSGTVFMHSVQDSGDRLCSVFAERWQRLPWFLWTPVTCRQKQTVERYVYIYIYKNDRTEGSETRDRSESKSQQSHNINITWNKLRTILADETHPSRPEFSQQTHRQKPQINPIQANRQKPQI